VLNLADGVVGMEGDGPSGGRPVALGFIAAAVDAFALDRILCRILGIDPRAVPTLRDCTGPDPATVGCALATLRPAHFALPSTLAARMAPAWIGRFLKPFIWFRPEIGAGCVACGQCVRACPATALVQDPGQPPRLNPKVCIGCCCCHEICPAHAVRMTQSPLLNLCHRGEMP
jgi:ferredoxin